MNTPSSRFAGTLRPALGRPAEHFAAAQEHLERAPARVPEDRRCPYEHWHDRGGAALLPLTPREHLQKALAATRLHVQMQRRFSRFFTAHAIVRTLPAQGEPGRAEAVAELEALREADQAAGHPR